LKFKKNIRKAETEGKLSKKWKSFQTKKEQAEKL
jgi:hypothetical protein